MPSDPANITSFTEWRSQFARERLRILYFLGLVANPVFLISDVLFYREQLPVLLVIRAILELGFLLVFFGEVRRESRLGPHVPLILWVLIGNLCIAQMTLYLGGFSSAYYNGLNLVFLAAAVIVPISWLTHLSAQVATLIYYYGANYLYPLTPGAAAAAIQNSFFLIWTCIACLFSVYLYEKLQIAEFTARLSERRAREELEGSHLKLLELDRLKDQFFANISHELRTPLTVSLGAFKTLQKLPLSGDFHAVVQSGLRNTSRLLFLINELLDLAKFESGRTDVRKVCVDLVSLVRNVSANFESSERQRIFIEGADSPVLIEVDVRKMTKVLYNLFANAFKFSDPNNGVVRIRLMSEDSHVAIEIQDNGIGIPKDQFEHIFERFTQVEGDVSRRYEGSGIGLALAREIVTLHGGHIGVQSTLGEGSTFTVTLPRGNVNARDVVPVEDDETLVLPIIHDDVSPSDQNVGNGKDTHGEQPLVLVVDDNADMRAYLIRLLTDEYRVVSAGNGAEALEQIRQLKPNLVVADIMMPVMTGNELMRAMRQDDSLRAIPIILLTARAGTEARVQSLEAGADDYVTKPFNEEELLARIKNQLRIHRQSRELESRAIQLQDLYAKLELANAELRAMSGRKSEFVSIVSHDLRTPLAAIGAFVDNLLEGMRGPLNEDQRQYLERIKANVARMVRMIADLLDLAKIEAGTIQFEPKAMSLVHFVDNLVENLHPVAKNKSITLRMMAEGMDFMVHGDSDKLSQILTNLVHNACKFTPAGGEVRIELKAAPEGFVQVCVADTGCGIPEAEIPHVFEKFYRGTSSSPEGRGVGLGLAIATHFVTLHQGRIWVESKEHEGSRFYFTLPRVESISQASS